MNSRERFFETLHYGNPDRVPYFEEGIREQVIAAWKEQGMPAGEMAWEQADLREEIKLDTDPYPRFERWPRTFDELEGLKAYYDPSDPRRLSDNWDPERLLGHDGVLMVRVHEGLFLSMGVGDARTFSLGIGARETTILWPTLHSCRSDQWFWRAAYDARTTPWRPGRGRHPRRAAEAE